MTRAIIEMELEAPRAVGQPSLLGKILMLPLRDDNGRVSRMLGVLVMSGRRGMGGRRLAIVADAPIRSVPIVSLRAVAPSQTTRPSLANSHAPHRPAKKAGDKPALRLVVSNS